jgi:hypothetical protein
MNGIGVLKELYDSEINFSISCDSDGGFDVRLGDEYNGWKESKNVRDLDVGVRWLMRAAIHHYPESDFAKQYRPTSTPLGRSRLRNFKEAASTKGGQRHREQKGR